jgi:hypothetical protein
MCILGVLLLVTISVAALSMGAGAGEGWIPARETDATGKVPVLIEWDGSYVVFHVDDDHVRVPWGKRITLNGKSIVVASDSPVPEFTERLDWLVERRRTHYALFAVRPSGFESFFRLKDAFTDRDVAVGYEPIAAGKPVKLLSARTQPAIVSPPVTRGAP